MLNCPKCGSPRIHRSRSRTFWERFRKNFTRDRLHRCHGCGWRGWGPVTSESSQPKEQATASRPPKIAAIDILPADAPVRQAGKDRS